MKRTRLIVMLAVCGLGLGTLFAGGSPESQALLLQQLRNSENAQTKPDEIQTDIDALSLLWRYVDSLYYQDVDNNAVKEKMAAAMLDALGDKYSFYTPSDETDDYMENISGKYGGIGVYLSKPSPSNIDPDDPKTYMVTIESPFRGSPAQRAGLMNGDLVSAIDGESVRDMTSSEASKKVRGEAGTDVTLTVHRGDATFDITLTRETIDTPVIQKMLLDGGIGYIQIIQYTDATSGQLLEAVRDLKGQGMTSLILDERYNGGGNVDEALKSADIFLQPGQTIVTMEGRKGTNANRRYVANGTQSIGRTLPLVILTNDGTASSAEIFAAALHDNKRATLIGTNTFGKGIYQSVFPFGDGFVQLTTGHYFTPSGENIHEKGIAPDIEVEDVKLSEEEIPAYEQLMKDKAPETFVQEHPEYSLENVQLFADQYKDSGVNEGYLKVLVRYQYYVKHVLTDMPIADPDLDPPLKRAMEFLESGK